MITELGLFKLPDLEPIRFQNLSIDTAMDSYSWLLRATIKDSASYALLQSSNDLEPVEVRAVLNGYTWDFVVTDTSGSIGFADHNWSMNAQSPIIYLSAPYAASKDYRETQQRTANQLADQEVVNTGFSVVWDTQDWLIPAKVFSYQNLTPLDAIKRIAGTVGAYVSAHVTDHSLTVSPRYPLEPWLWPLQVPITTLTASMAKTYSVQNYRYDNTNRVVVSGGNTGKVRVIAVRSGTAGDVSKDVFTDSLICHVDAGTERCRQILSAAGRHEDVVIAGIPIAPAPTPPGLLEVGDLVEVAWGNASPWIGMVTGVKVDAAIGSLLMTVTLDHFLEL